MVYLGINCKITLSAIHDDGLITIDVANIGLNGIQNMFLHVRFHLCPVEANNFYTDGNF